MVRVAWLLLVILIASTTSSLQAVLSPSEKLYSGPPPINPVDFESLWELDWSEDLDLRVESRTLITYSSPTGFVTTLYVTEVSYKLYPGVDCRIYAWLYATNSSSDYGILLVHGLGGDHKSFEEPLEEPLEGVITAYELASMGYLVLSIDAAGHGKSCIPGSSDWIEAARKTSAEDFLFRHVYSSAMRGVEALKQLGASPGRIAVAGVSMGGMTSIAVASLHPDVPLAVPIIAAGCFVCMVEAGGLANLVGDPRSTLDDKDVAYNISLSDPLVIAMNSLPGKTYYFLFATHDEFFPVEGLERVVEALKERGNTVAVRLMPNTNHVVPEEHLVSVLELFDSFKEGVVRVGDASARSEEPGFNELVGASYWWRPGFKGAYYLPGATPVTLLFSPQFFTEGGIEGFKYTSLPEELPPYLSLIVAFVAGAAAFYMAYTISIDYRRSALAVAMAVAASSPYWLPYIVWPGRFTMTLLDFMERFGATPGEATGIPSLELFYVTVVLSPILMGASVLAESRAGALAMVTVYLILNIISFGLARLTLSAIESRSGIDLPMTVYPLELVAIIIVIASTWLHVRKRGW
jgi:dienelactone hydrolase